MAVALERVLLAHAVGQQTHLAQDVLGAWRRFDFGTGTGTGTGTGIGIGIGIGIERGARRARAGLRRRCGEGLDAHLQSRADLDQHSGAQPPAWPKHRVPAAVLPPAHEKDLGASALGAAAEQPGGEDAAAVRDQEVAGPQQIGEVGEGPVLKPSRDAIQHKKPRLIALRERLLGDQLRREVVVVRREAVVEGGH